MRRYDAKKDVGNLALVRSMLTPAVQSNGQTWTLAKHLIFSLATKRQAKPIGTLAAHRNEIIRALDVLFTGF